MTKLVPQPVRSPLGMHFTPPQVFVCIVWPERSVVRGSKIDMWFSDAVANGEIDPEYTDAASTEERAHALNDAGIITLHRDSFIYR